MRFKFFLAIFSLLLLTSCYETTSALQPDIVIGAWGPLAIAGGDPSGKYYFSQIEESGEKIDASVSSSNKQLLVYPNSPLAAGATYLLYKDGHPEPVGEKISIRESCLAYLGEPNGNSEVWKKCPGEAPFQLTETDGRVKEYTVARDGGWIFFIAENDQHGQEIWRVSPAGTDLKLVYDCTPSTCSDLNFNSITNRLVFTQTNKSQRITLLDLFDTKVTDIQSAASELSFSPDGRYISFIDNRSGQLIVVNLADNHQITFQAGTGLMGEWSRNSNALLFGVMEYWGGIPGVKVFELKPETGEITAVLFDPNQDLEFYLPRYTRDDGVYLASVRQRKSGANRHFWLLRDGASGIKQITSDPLYHYSSPAWNSDYSELVFQRFPITESAGCPQVVVWNQESDTFQIIAENAAMPYWLP